MVLLAGQANFSYVPIGQTVENRSGLSSARLQAFWAIVEADAIRAQEVLRSCLKLGLCDATIVPNFWLRQTSGVLGYVL